MSFYKEDLCVKCKSKDTKDCIYEVQIRVDEKEGTSTCGVGRVSFDYDENDSLIVTECDFYVRRK